MNIRNILWSIVCIGLSGCVCWMRVVELGDGFALIEADNGPEFTFPLDEENICSGNGWEGTDILPYNLTTYHNDERWILAYSRLDDTYWIVDKKYPLSKELTREEIYHLAIGPIDANSFYLFVRQNDINLHFEETSPPYFKRYEPFAQEDSLTNFYLQKIRRHETDFRFHKKEADIRQNAFDSIAYWIDKAMEHEPNHPLLTLKKANVCLRLAHYDQAIAYIQQSGIQWKSFPDFPLCEMLEHHIRAMAYMSQGSYKKKDAQYQAIVKLIMDYIKKHNIPYHAEMDASIHSYTNYQLLLVEYFRYYTLLYGKTQARLSLASDCKVPEKLIERIEAHANLDFVVHTFF